MNKITLIHIAIRALWFSVVSLVIPCGVSMLLSEAIWTSYAIPIAALMLLALFLSRIVRDQKFAGLRRREGFLAVVIVWVTVVVATAVAFRLSGEFTGFAQAFFESMSGYTTTGASVISDIDNLPRSILFTRAFSHWIGGMGIIVLSVAILPELAVGGMQLFAAEATGIGTEKLAPRIATTARRLWVLYFLITGLQTIMLFLGPMNFFDSICHSMATIATGGFSTKSASIGHYDSLYVELVILFFMFLAGINFTVQYRALIGFKPGSLLKSPEVRLYALLVVMAIALITMNVLDSYNGIGQALRASAFTVVSIATTTGFGTADFELWPPFSQLLLVTLMLVGACAGSTAGGTKVIRLYIIIKHAALQMRRMVRPRLVQSIRVGKQIISEDTEEGIMGFYLLYFIALLISSLAMTALGSSLVSGTTAAISALNSIGPGLEAFGPTDNFGSLQDSGLYLLSFGMLLGRLEIYPLLVLFTISFWRRG